jgi:hypothetical protein
MCLSSCTRLEVLSIERFLSILNAYKVKALFEHTRILLKPKCAIKHEHAPMRLMTQQLVLLAVQTSLTDRDNRCDRYGEDQRADARIKITIMLS